MKIVHLCLSCFYIDGYGYQENQLPAQHVKDGHEVTIIASTESFDAERKPCYLEPADYMGSDGARVIRLPYRAGLPAALARKVRAYPGVRRWLDALQPDVILFHGMCAWELLTVARYARAHPSVQLYVDCHEDFNNSARGWVSRQLLHASFYRPILLSALDVVRRVLCITVESIQFATDFYRVPRSQVELFPLAGHIHDDADYHARRHRIRQAHGVAEAEVVIVQSGKITANKLLPDALRAFVGTPSEHLRFWIVGTIVDDAESCEALIASDPRIRFLGWKSPQELEDVLCAADVFLQPSGQTATTQTSMCCRCALVVSDVPSHRALFVNNGFLINSQTSLSDALRALASAPQQVEEMKQRSLAFARQNLDYTELARRLAPPASH